jgi:uncharacterized protein YjiS (DUF1127 family)
MSATAADFIAPASLEAGSKVLLRAGRAAANWARRARAIRRTRRALHTLADRALADIGIDRAEIDRIVRERLDDAGRTTDGHPF